MLAPLASLSLSNGALRLVSAKRGLDAIIDNVQGRFDGLTIGDQLRFNLSAVWRNTPIAIAGALDDPEAAAKGAPSPIVFALDSPLAKLVFGGSLALGDKPGADGDLTALHPVDRRPCLFPQRSTACRSCRRRHSDHREGQGRGGHADTWRRNADQRRADARGRDRYPRRRRAPDYLRHARRRNACARAAARTAGACLEPSGGIGARSRSRSRRCGRFDLDLRLSAAHLDVYGLKLADAAAFTSVTDGKLTATLMEAAAYGGRLQGEVGGPTLGGTSSSSARRARRRRPRRGDRRSGSSR